MDSTLSILGSLASIGGAIWAFVEARKSTNAATKAEALRNEIVQRRKLLEVSQVYVETRRILGLVSAAGPSSTPQLLRAINCAQIPTEIEQYGRSLMEFSSNCSDVFGNEAKSLCESLRADIEALAEAATPDEKKMHGKSAYYKIERFIPVAKQYADDRRELK